MTLLVRTFAILGLALTVAMVHSWVGAEIRLEPDATVRPGRALPDAPAQIADATPADPKDEPASGEIEDDDQGAPVEPDAASPEPDAPAAQQPDVGSSAEGASSSPEAAAEPARMDPRTFPPEISLAQARYLYQFIESGDVVFIDARGIREQYLEGHIRGAMNIDADDIAMGSPEFIQFMDFTPTDVWIVIYCSGGDCDESKHVKIDLQPYGYESIFIFTEGYPAWEEAGLPTASGPDPWGE